LGDNQPTCGHPLTVRHMLLDYIDLQDVRRRHFPVTCLRDCLIPLTIALLLILSKTSAFIAYYSISFYIFVAFNSVYHKTVVLCTHLLIRKTFLFIY